MKILFLIVFSWFLFQSNAMNFQKSQELNPDEDYQAYNDE